jgi:hypothetical protein
MRGYLIDNERRTVPEIDFAADFKKVQAILSCHSFITERLIRTMWSNARSFRGEAQRKSSWQFGD